MVKPLEIITIGFNKTQQAALLQLVLEPNTPDIAQGLGGWYGHPYDIQNQNDVGETITPNAESYVNKSKI